MIMGVHRAEGPHRSRLTTSDPDEGTATPAAGESTGRWYEPEKNLTTQTWEAHLRRPLTRAEREDGLLSVVAGLSEAEVRKLMAWQDDREKTRPRTQVSRQRISGSW
ncbi:hypothetical protein [Actinomadura xylanilytica]|uniref:hypothetical protein n=1 Tax=Actinomadura xylanilytica TaxID=887459 RepID=UPI00255AC29B|nr:hypothetical protein [Actinomadura xylanilytica]MDL4772882.1 hypothetical protein [Actinomadura xylanilytica]